VCSFIITVILTAIFGRTVIKLTDVRYACWRPYKITLLQCHASIKNVGLYRGVCMWWSHALDCHVIRITPLCYLWSCSLELSTSSHSRPIFIIILFLQPSQNRTFLQGVWSYCSRFVIAYLQEWANIILLTYLLTYVADMAMVDFAEIMDSWSTKKHAAQYCPPTDEWTLKFFHEIAEKDTSLGVSKSYPRHQRPSLPPYPPRVCHSGTW